MISFWIVIVLLNVIQLVLAQDVQLSIDNSTESEYVGHVWANSKFVFLTPSLRATVMKGKSVSEKICGFELTSPQLKTVPFMVYLVDELSGLGEIQVKPHIDLDYQKEAIMRFTIEAYDCDMLPHYSNRVSVAIHVSNMSGPKFDKNAYSFSIKKNTNVGEVIGRVYAKGLENEDIDYSLYHVGHLPFSIDRTGTIRTISTLESINNSLIYFRVIATVQSNKVSRKSIASITVEIIPICKNKLFGIPDQLDYKIKSGIMEAERLIQDQHQPRLEFCDLTSPFKEIRLAISLMQSPESQISSDNIKICQTDIAASRLQRRVCNVHPGTIDLFLNQGGIIELNDATKSVGPEIIPYLNNEFSLLWWMKRYSKEDSAIFCLQNKNSEKTISIHIVDCKIIVSISGSKEEFKIPTEVCLLKTWIHYAMSMEWRMNSYLTISVSGVTLPSALIKPSFIHLNGSRFLVGQCSPSVSNFQGERSLKNQLQVGVISFLKDKSVTTEAVGCMSTCGEALLAPDSMKKWPEITLTRKRNSLNFVSTKIAKIINILSKVDYVNSYYSTSGKQPLDKVTTHVAIDVFIVSKSGQTTIKIPTTLIKVNIVLPQKDQANDTMEVDIYAASTVETKKLQSIRLFPNFHFVNSITEEPIKRDIKIEVCIIRPLQRNFMDREKIYLARIMVPLVIEYNLKIKNDSGSWTLEGEGSAELYENILRQVMFDMVSERRKLFIICTLKNGELTSQAFVDVILEKKSKVTLITEENPTGLDHNSINEQKQILEREDKYSAVQFKISKSKFIAIVVMAVIGGATWAVLTVAFGCFIIRRRGNIMTRNRMKLNDIKSYQRESSPTFNSRPQLSYTSRNVCTHYEEEEDRVSMADVPDADEHCLDNISCETCNMTDHESTFTNINPVKDIPRSKTINFPIIHKRF